MSVGVSRLLPRGGTAIFCVGRFCVLAKSLQTGRLKHWKKCLSAQNASCRAAAPPFFAWGRFAHMVK